MLFNQVMGKLCQLHILWHSFTSPSFAIWHLKYAIKAKIIKFDNVEQKFCVIKGFSHFLICNTPFFTVIRDNKVNHRSKTEHMLRIPPIKWVEYYRSMRKHLITFHTRTFFLFFKWKEQNCLTWNNLKKLKLQKITPL